MSMDKKGQLVYPYNLLDEVFANKEYELTDLSEDMADGLTFAISALGERRKAIVQMHYAEGKSVREIAEFFGVSISAIHTMKRNAVMRLRRPNAMCYITYGKKGFEEREQRMRLEKKVQRNSEHYQQVMGVRFEELDLSVRSFNCLRRAGFVSIGDIVDLTEDEIIQIKNMGWKQYDEIGRKLLARGVTDSTWIGFIQNKI